MIELTIYEMINAEPVLNKLLNVSFNGKKAFVISRLLKQIADEEKMYNEARVEILKKYADKDENGNPVVINDDISMTTEARECAVKEIEELLGTKIQITSNKIPLEWLEDIEMTPLEAINWAAFIEE